MVKEIYKITVVYNKGEQRVFYTCEDEQRKKLDEIIKKDYGFLSSVTTEHTIIF